MSLFYLFTAHLELANKKQTLNKRVNEFCMITVVTTFFNNNEKPLPLYSTISFKFFLPWVRVIYTYVRRIEIANTVILPLLTCLFSIPVSIELLQILQTTFDGL